MRGNMNPEQIARELIDEMLIEAGWVVQSKKEMNIFNDPGVAVREYQNTSGFADYTLFVDSKAVGVIEAKKENEGQNLSNVEEQVLGYSHSKLKYLNNESLRFVYESTGTLTMFSDLNDPKPRFRRVFHFHKPETLKLYCEQENTLRGRLQQMPPVIPDGLRKIQFEAISNLEKSLKENRPRALIQMATGAGKTFTACTFIYRLLKHAKAERILFLVDTRNLGNQAIDAFKAFVPNDSNMSFQELYTIQQLKSRTFDTSNVVYVSTIQRLYSILKDEELDIKLEEENPHERKIVNKEPVPAVYNKNVPIEFFDFIVIDECHRSIYNVWSQVLEYFDAFLIGLTATPDDRTYGFFKENVVSEYTFEQSILDGVNVGYDIYKIDTDITKNGATILKSEGYVPRREKLTRKKRWEQIDEDIKYTGKNLDRDIVNLNTIRTIIKEFRRILPSKFPDRNINGVFEVPKTLIFAKTDSHAEDIVSIVREEFAEGSDFCKKITCKSDEDPSSLLSRFRNAWAPRIAVTVDMIATGTDVKPLEIVFFMRNVSSKNYYAQMIGRGCRSVDFDDLKKVSQGAKFNKSSYLIVDAVGVTESAKVELPPMDKKKSVPLKDLLYAAAVNTDEDDVFTTLATRLTRLDKKMDENDHKDFKNKINKTVNEIAKELIDVCDPDVIEQKAQTLFNEQPPENKTDEVFQKCKKQAREELKIKACSNFNGEVNEFILNIKRKLEQIIDNINIDEVVFTGWSKEAQAKAENLIEEFSTYIKENRDKITALGIFYNYPYRKRELNLEMVEELHRKLLADKPRLATSNVWNAYDILDKTTRQKPHNKFVALVSLVRSVCGIDNTLTPFEQVVNRNFKEWAFRKQAGDVKYSQEQMDWLRMIKEHIMMSFHIEKNNLNYTPFNDLGGIRKMWDLFGSEMTNILDELNEELVA